MLQRRQAGELDETAERALTDKVFAIRYGNLGRGGLSPALDNVAARGHPWPGRIPAVTDTKMIVAWNSLTIPGLAKVVRVFGDCQALELAIAAANFIWESQRLEDGTFVRLNYAGTVVESAKSEDYAGVYQDIVGRAAGCSCLPQSLLYRLAGSRSGTAAGDGPPPPG